MFMESEWDMPVDAADAGPGFVIESEEPCDRLGFLHHDPGNRFARILTRQNGRQRHSARLWHVQKNHRLRVAAGRLLSFFACSSLLLRHPVMRTFPPS